MMLKYIYTFCYLSINQIYDNLIDRYLQIDNQKVYIEIDRQVAMEMENEWIGGNENRHGIKK